VAILIHIHVTNNSVFKKGKDMENNEDDFSDVMIPYVEFAENANERTPCILVLDCSGSMRGEPIKQLNTGLQALEKELKEDIDASLPVIVSGKIDYIILKNLGKNEDWLLKELSKKGYTLNKILGACIINNKLDIVKSINNNGK
jgi:hypothetical protein